MTHDTQLVMLADYPLYQQQARAIDLAEDVGTMTPGEALRARQRLFGICSEGDCDQPIAGYHGLGPKLCMLHLAGYLQGIEQGKRPVADPAELALLAQIRAIQARQAIEQHAGAFRRAVAALLGRER